MLSYLEAWKYMAWPTPCLTIAVCRNQIFNQTYYRLLSMHMDWHGGPGTAWQQSYGSPIDKYNNHNNSVVVVVVFVNIVL